MSDSQTILRRWVEALRSGEYQQTTGTLGQINSDGSKSCEVLGGRKIAKLISPDYLLRKGDVTEFE